MQESLTDTQASHVWIRRALIVAAVIVLVAVASAYLRARTLSGLPPDEVARSYWATWNPLERTYLSAELPPPDSPYGRDIVAVEAYRPMALGDDGVFDLAWSDTHVVIVLFRHRGDRGSAPTGDCSVLVGRLEGEERYRVLDYGENCSCGTCWLTDKYGKGSWQL